MRLCVDLPDDLSLRWKYHLLKQYGTAYGVQQQEVIDILSKYLDESMAPPMHEKKSEKKKAPVSRQGETKRPRIKDDPALVKKIDAMLADGKTIQEIASEIGYAWSTVKSYLSRKDKIK
jgi:DNA-binding NarL/FixJ family response regulator